MAVETDRLTLVELDVEAQRIQTLLETNNLTDAVTAAEKALLISPTHCALLYRLAVGQRLLLRTPDALATLERLEDAHPDYPRLFQERGHCYVELRSADQAIEAFEAAVNRNASLPASWLALKSLYSMTGRTADSDTAAAHVRKLASLPTEIATAFSMYSDGETPAAEALIRHYLLTKGEHIEAMRLLAKIGLDLDIADDADLLLSRILEMAPDYHAARYEYVVTLLKQHKHLKALEQIDQLLGPSPDNAVYRTTRAAILSGIGAYERALPLFNQLLLERPRDPDLRLSIAHAQKTMGNQELAINSYRKAAELRPQFGDAYWSLANLKTYRFDEQEISQMRQQEASRRLRVEDRFHLCFALGKALEDRGEYAESWIYYERGNALKLVECRYVPEVIESNARRQTEVCTDVFFAKRRNWGCHDKAPIFIVGLPRAGSTLLEQILASHSQVEGTMELADIPRFVAELRGRATMDGDPRYPAALTDISPATAKALGDRYIEETRAYRTGKPFFIDKMPNNFRHLGLIHLILPNAKIIDARREPMACCFSNYKQLFASGQQFTYSIEHIARYYRSYVELMEHWDAVLPGKILRVQHEEVVADLQSNVRRILDFCGLEFEHSCMDFHKTARRVHTASSEQVRRPIYKDGLDQWRHYEPWLGPLREALRPGVVSQFSCSSS